MMRERLAKLSSHFFPLPPNSHFIVFHTSQSIIHSNVTRVSTNPLYRATPMTCLDDQSYEHDKLSSCGKNLTESV